MSNKLALMEKLKNTMQEVEWHSTFDFEKYEISEEDKIFIEKKEELITNNFKKYSSSKYEICLALVDVKIKLKQNDTSFMAWYTHLGFTKDKVSELLKTYELYIQAPHLKDYISNLSGLAVRILTHKNVPPLLALDIMESGAKTTEEIKEWIELYDSSEVVKKEKNNNKISKKSISILKTFEKEIKKGNLKNTKNEILSLKKMLGELEKEIQLKERELENKNNLKLGE